MRDFKINGKKFDNPAREYGVVPCSEVKESGLYFGKEGGYAVLEQEFTFTSNYAIEMEIRPRTKNALLLSVGVLEFASVHIQNGNVVFMIDMGSGTYNVSAVFTASNTICDGHWHHIKVSHKVFLKARIKAFFSGNNEEKHYYDFCRSTQHHDVHQKG